jgi:hypothetical protein
MTDTKVKRSGCLTAFIIIMIVLYALGAIGSFVAGPLLAGMLPEYDVSAGNPIFNALLSVLSIVFLIGVWKYKKWGFYGFVAVAVLNIILSIFTTGSIIGSIISGLIFPVILYFLLRPIWNHMS